ncbi:MAG: tetratricopeptide repeat protein [Candidatus Marinimicrobia bacterium]|nr:tetratricopeptide repeat protein [Candidatus Neomarinimicrobiota bacterium]
MSDTDYTEEQKFHHYMGIELNNQTWNLLGKDNRGDKDNQRMIQFAQGSLYHWLLSPLFEKINEQRGEWMISHVFAVLGQGEQALVSAEKCMALTTEFGFEDFDLGYACEGMARAHAASGNDTVAIDYFEKAKAAAEQVKGDEDRKQYLSDLESGPWFDCGLPK